MVGSELGAHEPRNYHSSFEGADVFVPAGWIPLHEGLRRARERRFGESTSHSYTSEELAEYRHTIEKAPHCEDWRVIVPEVRQLCFSGSIGSSILSEAGELLEVPRENWGGLEFKRMVSNGETSVLNGSRIVTGRVLLALEPLDSAFPTTNGEYSADPESLPYLSPFMLYMMRASRELGLSAEKRLPKKEIVFWLRSNWPPELGNCSRYLIEAMATLLRRPEDMRGGIVR